MEIWQNHYALDLDLKPGDDSGDHALGRWWAVDDGGTEEEIEQW